MTGPFQEDAAAAERVSGVDSAWLRMDDPTNLMVINGVLVFDREMGDADLAAVIERRLLPIRRFRHRITLRGGKRHWETDSQFSLGRHLHSARLEGAGGDDELQAFVSARMAEPLPLDRPLWSFHLVQNYRGGSALLGRLHHAIGDGLALMLVLLSLTDTSAGDGDEPAIANPFGALFRQMPIDVDAARAAAERIMPEGVRLLVKPSEALRSRSAVVRGLGAAAALGKMTFRSTDSPSVFKGPLGVEKRVAWSEPIEMETLRALQKKLGGTVNDLLLTAMSGGLARYMKQRGLPGKPSDFRAAVPVSLRPLEEMAALGNRFGLVFLTLPVGIEHPVERLAELRRRMRQLKRSAEALVVFWVLSALGRVPNVLQRQVVRLFGTKATAVMTNVPGPNQTLFMAGSPIRDMFFWVPQSGKLGLGISILTYAGRVRLGVVSDAGLVPDPQGIVDGFSAEFEHMRDLADS